MKVNPLPYLPNLFASCMVFMVLYCLCVMLWVFFPNLVDHTILITIFPGFQLLDMLMSAIYGWFISAVFVFFYTLWPVFARLLYTQK